MKVLDILVEDGTRRRRERVVTMPRGKDREVGELVRRRRVLLGLSQGQLAVRCGRTREWVSALERGVMNKPGWEPLELVEIALGMRPGQLRAAAGYRVGVEPERERKASDMLRAALAEQLEREEREEQEGAG